MNIVIDSKHKIEKILFCSVVPFAYKIIKKFFFKKYKSKCIELKELKISNYIRLKVNKKQIGSDRIANAIGVMNGKDNFIVIDLGSATTFDIIQKSSYVGGVIAPGIELSLNNLSAKASLIPNVKFMKMSKVIGKNTISSVRSGFYWGYIGLIDNIIKLIKLETNRKYKIILTGGLSYLFKKKINHKIIINKNVTFLGLRKILKLEN